MSITNTPEPSSKTVIANESKSLELVKALNQEGLDVYAFILIDAKKKKEFEENLSIKNINLETLGKVIKSGYGENPDAILRFELIEAFKAGELF